jgi:hypothetical protein
VEREKERVEREKEREREREKERAERESGDRKRERVEREFRLRNAFVQLFVSLFLRARHTHQPVLEAHRVLQKLQFLRVAVNGTVIYKLKDDFVNFLQHYFLQQIFIV